MKWNPLGVVFRTEDWAQTPTPLVMQDRVRIYYAARLLGKAYIRYVDLDIDEPTKIIAGPSDRVLENGKPGCFDDEGQMPSFAESDGHNVTLYYSGWNSRNTIPYHNATGIAYSSNGGRTFTRKHDGPLLDRTQDEPYLRVTPCKESHRLWYVSGLRWEMIDGRYEPIYVIRRKNYNGENPVAIPQAFDRECFSRPWVIKRDGRWVMTYSHRSAVDYRDGKNAYQLGYSESENGEKWEWRWSVDLPRTPGFDDTMRCYAATFDVKGKTYMVFNGNSFGRYGFALAVMQ